MWLLYDVNANLDQLLTWSDRNRYRYQLLITYLYRQFFIYCFPFFLAIEFLEKMKWLSKWRKIGYMTWVDHIEITLQLHFSYSDLSSDMSTVYILWTVLNWFLLLRIVKNEFINWSLIWMIMHEQLSSLCVRI